jgi:hypothetical protein
VHETLAPYAHQDGKRTLEAMPVIARLLQGLPLTEEYWEQSKREALTYTWIPVRTRGVHTGDTVRVRIDAYEDGDPLVAHNGRRGTVVALRAGVRVSYDDIKGKSTDMGTRHAPDKLEVQVPIRRRVTQ